MSRTHVSRNDPCPCGSGKKYKSCCRTGPARTIYPSLPAFGSLSELASLSDEALGRFDIAAINLACAAGLPGSEQLDYADCLARLDALADWVRRYTEEYFDDFVQKPADFEDSEAYFRILAMVTVLQKGGGVRYHPERMLNPDFTDSRDLFIHGILFGEGGTCASLPILYLAVGRRLGYPLRLVGGNGHLLARWDAPQERFNIECTSRGLLTYPDAYYEEWPHPIGEQGRRAKCFLISLTPRQEMAIMLTTRGHCLEDNGWAGEASSAYSWSWQLFPTHLGIECCVRRMTMANSVFYTSP